MFWNTRRGVWLAVVGTGVALSLAKMLFGWEPEWHNVFDAAYWSGATLLAHYYFNKSNQGD